MGHTRPSALYSGFHLSEETYRFLSRSARLCRKRSAYSSLPSFSLHSSANRCRLPSHVTTRIRTARRGDCRSKYYPRQQIRAFLQCFAVPRTRFADGSVAVELLAAQSSRPRFLRYVRSAGTEG